MIPSDENPGTSKIHTLCLYAGHEMNAGSDDDLHSTHSSCSEDSEGDPWVRVRTLATQAASIARATTFTKKNQEPSTRWRSAAGKLLTEMLHNYPELPKPSDPAKFCARWEKAFMERSSVHDAPRSGRKTKVPLEDLEAAVGLVIALEPRTQQEFNESPVIQGLLRKHKVSAQTLWRQIRKVEPRLGKNVLTEYKMILTMEVKQDRLLITTQWLKSGIQPGAGEQVALAGVDGAGPSTPVYIARTPTDLNLSYISRIIWLDAKKFYIKPQNYKRWGLLGAPSRVIQDKRVRGAWVVHFYSAVNYTYGGLHFQLVTGTHGKGYKPAKRPYKVQFRAWDMRVNNDYRVGHPSSPLKQLGTEGHPNKAYLGNGAVQHVTLPALQQHPSHGHGQLALQHL